jgi:hypothetical protein
VLFQRPLYTRPKLPAPSSSPAMWQSVQAVESKKHPASLKQRLNRHAAKLQNVLKCICPIKGENIHILCYSSTRLCFRPATAAADCNTFAGFSHYNAETYVMPNQTILSQLTKGDVVVFNSPNAWTCHAALHSPSGSTSAARPTMYMLHLVLLDFKFSEYLRRGSFD